MNNEEFEKLEFNKQCEVIFKSSHSAKGDLIIRSENPAKLVNSFSPEEFYLTIREMDSVDRAEIIQYANFPQLEFITDVECWKNNYISGIDLIKWMRELSDAGTEKLAEWLLNVDFTFLTAAFQKILKVVKPFHEERPDDILGDNPYFTLDGLYYIMINEDDMDIVREAITILFDMSRSYYVNLLEGILAYNEDVIEEESLENRFVRLEERGFPRKEDAMKIYEILSSGEFDRNAKRTDKDESVPFILAAYPVVSDREIFFFDNVLLVLSEQYGDIVKDVYQELIWLSNKVIMSKGVEYFEEREVEATFFHIKSILSLALEEISGKNLIKAAEVAANNWIEFIFRYGVTLLIDIRKKFEKLYKRYWSFSLEKLYDFFETPYGSMLRGIYRNLPLFYDENYTVNYYKLREFRSVDELFRYEELYSEAEALFELLSSDNYSGWEELLTDDSLTLNSDDRTFVSLVMTSFVNFALNGNILLKPVGLDDFKVFTERFFIYAGDEDIDVRRELKKEVKVNFIKEVYVLLDNKREIVDNLKNILDFAFRIFEDEISLLPKNGKYNINYLHKLIIK